MRNVHLSPLFDVVGHLAVMSIKSSFFDSDSSVLTSWMSLLSLSGLVLVDAACCLCNLRCPFAVSTLLVQNWWTLLLLRPGKLVNHPLLIAAIHVVIGGAPGDTWQKLMSAVIVL